MAYHYKAGKGIAHTAKDYAKAVSPIRTDSTPILPAPAEKQGITGERLNKSERAKGKRESVKPLSAGRRDVKGRLITQKPREQTLLRVKMPRSFENEYGIEKQALFSEMIEPDEKAESIAESLKRESLPIVKALVARIRKGEFLTDEQFIYSPEFMALEQIAKRANVCLKCHKAIKWSDREYFDAKGEHTTQYIAKCRPFYLFARINGIAQYRLWCGYKNGKAVLAKRRVLLNSKGNRIGAYAIELDARPFGVPEMVQIDKKCKC